MSFASQPRQGAMQMRPIPPPPQAPVAPALQGLLNTIAVLEAVVEEETAALNAHSHVNLEAFSQRKSQGLMELNRAMKSLGALGNHQLLAVRLGSLREKLAVNQATLKFHLEAVREISTIVANAIRESESDGTYSQSIRNPASSYGYD